MDPLIYETETVIKKLVSRIEKLLSMDIFAHRSLRTALAVKFVQAALTYQSTMFIEL